MGARVVSAVVALAAAAVVCGVVVWRRGGRWRRVAVSERLMAGCVARDNAALRGELERFRCRMGGALEREAVVSAAVSVVDDALAADAARIDRSEGGSK